VKLHDRPQRPKHRVCSVRESIVSVGGLTCWPLSNDIGAVPPPDRSAGSTARSAFLVGLGILGARLAGLVRQRVLAHFLGTSDTADAVMAAFRIGNITQNLLGEGTLSASFIPVYARLRAAGGDAAARFARNALGAVLAIVAIVTVAGLTLAPWIAALVASGFEGDKLALTIELVRVLFPMTGLLVLGAWSLGILTAHRRFFMPYVAPVLWSAAQIAAVVVVAQREGVTHARLAFAIAWGAVAGAVLQLVVMAWPLRALIGALRPTLDVRDPNLREAASTLPSALLGRGVLQLSGLVDTALVGLLGSGAIATVNYAQTLYLLPMALLGTGEAAAALPELAERAGDRSEEAKASIVASLGRTLTRVFTLGLGATVALGVLAPELVTLLLRGGRFDGGAAADVARALSTYALGLSANAASRVLAAASFALGDTSRPARFATIRVVVSTAGSIALMRSFGVSGVIAGAVIAAWVELALLARAVRDRLGGTGLAAVPFARILGACAITAGAGLGARHGLATAALPPLARSAVVLVAGGTTFAVSIGATGVLPIRALLRRTRRR